MGVTEPDPTQSGIQTVLRSYLLSILPTGVEVTAAQVNRVPQPKAKNHVVMTPILRRRLSTNAHEYADCAFMGSIAATTMTVTEMLLGTIVPGRAMWGVGVAVPTIIVAQVSGAPGGVGTYTVTPSQSVAERKLAAGVQHITQATELHMQLDVHGPASSQNAQIIATMFWDDEAFQHFAGSGIDCRPLYASDPRQIPFIDGEQQWEDRYVVDVALQANQSVTIGRQFADQIEVETIDVQGTYPA